MRADDAAIVPMSFSAKLPERDNRRVGKLTLVIDENPAPLAATFTLGENAGDTRISTRVRVNSYTNTRVVAELSDGSEIVINSPQDFAKQIVDEAAQGEALIKRIGVKLD